MIYYFQKFAELSSKGARIVCATSRRLLSVVIAQPLRADDFPTPLSDFFSASRCLTESIAANKALPLSPYPLYARFMEGIAVALDEAMDSTLRAQLCNLARYMGASCVDVRTQQCNYLVADVVGSLSYKVRFPSPHSHILIVISPLLS